MRTTPFQARKGIFRQDCLLQKVELQISGNGLSRRCRQHDHRHRILADEQRQRTLLIAAHHTRWVFLEAGYFGIRERVERAIFPHGTALTQTSYCNGCQLYQCYLVQYSLRRAASSLSLCEVVEMMEINDQSLQFQPSVDNVFKRDEIVW